MAFVEEDLLPVDPPKPLRRGNTFLFVVFLFLRSLSLMLLCCPAGLGFSIPFFFFPLPRDVSFTFNISDSYQLSS